MHVRFFCCLLRSSLLIAFVVRFPDDHHDFSTLMIEEVVVGDLVLVTPAARDSEVFTPEMECTVTFFFFLSHPYRCVDCFVERLVALAESVPCA